MGFSWFTMLLERIESYMDNEMVACKSCGSDFWHYGMGLPPVCPNCGVSDEDGGNFKYATLLNFFEKEVQWQAYLGDETIQFQWRDCIATVHLDNGKMTLIDPLKRGYGGLISPSVGQISAKKLKEIRACFSYDIRREQEKKEKEEYEKQ